MDVFRNLKLHATGPAAVICVWFICMTVLGVSGNPMAFMALGPVAVFGTVVVLVMLSEKK
jgi:hypothetical protein